MAETSFFLQRQKKNYWIPLYDKYIENGRTEESRKRLCLDTVKASRARLHVIKQLSKEDYIKLFE